MGSRTTAEGRPMKELGQDTHWLLATPSTTGHWPIQVVATTHVYSDLSPAQSLSSKWGMQLTPFKPHGHTPIARNGEGGAHAFKFLHRKALQVQGSQEMTNGHSSDPVPLKRQIFFQEFRKDAVVG